MIQRLLSAARLLACAALVTACGGGSGPAQPPAAVLPAVLQLSIPSTTEVAADNAFATDVPANAAGLQFAWEFGDGGTSTEARPRHRYTSAALHTVRVTVRDAAGRQVSVQGTVQVVPHLRLHGLRCSGSGTGGWCRQIAQPWKPALRDLQFAGTATAWGVGEGGAVLQTRDGGQTWTDVSIEGVHRLAAVWPIDTRRGWMVGWATGGQGRAWRTADGGSSWVESAAPVPVAFPLRLQVLSEQVLVVWGAREGSAPAITEDGGRSWRVLPLDVHHVEADGTLWGLPVTPEGQSYNAHPGIAFRKSTDLGRSFVAEPGWPADGVVDWMGLSDEGWAWALSSKWGGELGSTRVFTLLTRRGAAAPWAVASLPTTGRVSDLLVTPTGSIAVTIGTLASSLALWQSSDAGGSWASRSWPVDHVGQWGLIDGRSLHASFWRNVRPSVSTDGGQSWVQDRPGAALPDNHQVRSVLRSPQGLVLRSSAGFGRNPRSSWQWSNDGGRSWSDLWRASAEDPRQAVAELWLRNRQRGLAVTFGGTVLDTDDGGRSWRVRDPASLPANGAARLSRLQTAPDGALWALAGGRLVRSADDGRSWQDAPGQPGLSLDPAYSTQDFAWLDADRLYVVQTYFHVFSPHYPGTYTTTVHRSDDAGRTWRALPSTDCERVALASPTHGVCLRAAQSHYTTDGGQTWQPAGGDPFGLRGDVRRIVRSAGSWWALGSRQLMRSDDEGRSWRVVPLPQLPQRLDDSGQLVQVILNDIVFSGARGWIVGQEGLVLASDDGGASWTPQPSGVHSELHKVFALDADNLWVGAEQTVLATATGGR